MGVLGGRPTRPSLLLAVAKRHDSTALDVMPEDVLAVLKELDIAVAASWRKQEATAVFGPLDRCALVLALVILVTGRERDGVASRGDAQPEGEGCNCRLTRAPDMHVLAEVRERWLAGQLPALAKRDEWRSLCLVCNHGRAHDGPRCSSCQSMERLWCHAVRPKGKRCPLDRTSKGYALPAGVSGVHPVRRPISAFT